MTQRSESNASPNCEDFSSVVASYISNVSRMKTIREEMKKIRSSQEQLEAAIISYMETKSLDVCRISSGPETGELCTTTKKSKAQLKREQQVAFIAEFFENQGIEFQEGTASTKADELFDNMQKQRPQTEKKALILRKK